MKVPPEMEKEQDEQGRLWDILWMFRVYAGKNRDEQIIRFKLSCRLPDKGDWLPNETFEDDRLSRIVTLKAICSANDIDDLQPAIFIMLPDED